MVEERLEEDKAALKAHKRKWKRRWCICSCICCVLFTAGVIVAIVVLAIAPWSLLNDSCDWEPRSHFGAVYTGHDIIIAAGAGEGVHFQDVWKSDRDGEDWQRLTDKAGFGPRQGHALVYDHTKGDLYVLAGLVGRLPKTSSLGRDVWRSTDGGRKWTRQISVAPWPARKQFGAAADTEGRLVIFGGESGYRGAALNDAWVSSNQGKTWRPLALASSWSARHSFVLARLPGGTRSGRFYILGGDNGRWQHDVWSSDDEGRSWRLNTFTHTKEMRHSISEERASWTPRIDFAGAAGSDGLLTITGGITAGHDGVELSNEVWQLESPGSPKNEWYERKTNDPRLNMDRSPLEWEKQSEPPWKARRGHAMFVDEDNIPHVLGGRDAEGAKNDLWRMKSSFDFRNLIVQYERIRKMIGWPVDEADVTTNSTSSLGGVSNITNVSARRRLGGQRRWLPPGRLAAGPRRPRPAPPGGGRPA